MIKLRKALCAIGVAAGVLMSAPLVQAQPTASSETIITGSASWYGAELNGRTTASGEPFDMDDLTAAHPTLPFGTIVRVTNQDNGKSVIVRVNDRGPFSGKRVIDLSRKAAKSIGMLKRGVGRVKIEILERA